MVMMVSAGCDAVVSAVSIAKIHIHKLISHVCHMHGGNLINQINLCSH